MTAGDDGEDLAWIPRSVRTKLDRACLRIHLADWQRLSLGQRRRLVELPADTPAEIVAFRASLLELIPTATQSA